MGHDTRLRPLERRVLRLAGEGMAESEIARRFRRSPDGIRRVIALARMPRPGAGGPHVQGDVLRPLERRVLRWRARGARFDDLAPRFRRSPEFLERVEELAHYKLHRT